MKPEQIDRSSPISNGARIFNNTGDTNCVQICNEKDKATKWKTKTLQIILTIEEWLGEIAVSASESRENLESYIEPKNIITN